MLIRFADHLLGIAHTYIPITLLKFELFTLLGPQAANILYGALELATSSSLAA